MPGLLPVVSRRLCTMAGKYVSGTHSMAFVTVPNNEVAKKLAHAIVERKLAACVNILPAITSVYVWDGAVQEDSELMLMIKTSTEKVPDLTTYVRENHPYEVCEVITSKIDDGNPPYLKWITDTVGDSGTTHNNDITK